MNLISKLFYFVFALFLASCSSNERNELLPNPLHAIKKIVTIKPVWKVQIDNSENEYLNLKPAPMDGNLVAASSEGRVMMLNAKSGKPIWIRNIKEGIVGGVSSFENKLVVSTLKGNVILLDSKGNELWRFFIGREVLSNAVFTNNLIYIQTQDDQVYALNINNGKVVWSYKESQPSLTLYGTASPVIYKKSLIVAFSNGKIISFSLDGKTKWEKQISVPLGKTELTQMVDLKSDLIVENDILYSAGYQGKLIALNPNNGDTIWQHNFSSINNLLYDNDFIYLVDVEANVIKVNINNSSIVWTNNDLLRRNVSAAQKTNLNYIALGDYQGYLHLIGKDSGKISSRLKISKNPIHIQPILQDNLLIVYEDGGMLHAFEIVEK